MPAADFLKVTDQIRKHYNPNKLMIVITGGEPLVRRDLEEVGKELYKQGYPWGFVTNGLALDEKRFRNLMNSGLRSVTVSLDGFEENHNWLRGRDDSYEKALQALSLIVSEKELVYDVVTCVNSRNINELDRLKEFLMERGVKKWRLFTIDPIGRARTDTDLNLTAEQLLLVMEFLKKTRSEKAIDVSYGCEGFLGDFESEVRDSFFFCRAGIHIASVLVDGSISVCPNNSRHAIQGNIYKDDFMDVWMNRFSKMRDKSWAKKGECADCKEFKWCRGNGFHIWDFENEKVMMCHYKMLEEAARNRSNS